MWCKSAWVAFTVLSWSLLVAAAEVGTGANWPAVGGGNDESSYSQLDKIKSTNIPKLGLNWFLDLPGEVSLEATPLAVNGVLYFTGSYSAVYAVNGASGKLLWRFDPQTWKFAPSKMNVMLYPVNRGAAYADGRVFSAATDGRLFALDAKTGAVLWTVDTLWNGGVLATAGNLVFQGAADGYLSAYDATTGQRVWKFDAGLGIIGAPMSYAIGGKQYVSVLVGYGGSAGAMSRLMQAREALSTRKPQTNTSQAPEGH